MTVIYVYYMQKSCFGFNFIVLHRQCATSLVKQINQCKKTQSLDCHIMKQNKSPINTYWNHDHCRKIYVWHCCISHSLSCQYAMFSGTRCLWTISDNNYWTFKPQPLQYSNTDQLYESQNIKLQYKYTYTCVKESPNVNLPSILFDALCFYCCSSMLLTKVVYDTWCLRRRNVVLVPEVWGKPYKD